MKTQQIVAALLAAATVITAAPVFASGYGPAPFYRPSVGAPASQRGQNTETIAVEHQNGADAQEEYGGVAAGTSQSASRRAVAVQGDIYARH
jgi:hypothetical protein